MPVASLLVEAVALRSTGLLIGNSHELLSFLELYLHRASAYTIAGSPCRGVRSSNQTAALRLIWFYQGCMAAW